MRYLYGDSSSFPLNQNFIETLAAATDTCVALLQVDEALIKAQRTAEEANAAAISEIADIERLGQRVTRVLADRSQLSKATARVAEEVAGASEKHFARAQKGVKAWRDATLRKAMRGCGPAAFLQPIHEFMARHELPYTTWGVRWKAGRGEEPVQAQAYAIMQRGLTATLSIEIPRKHLWAQPIKVSQLERKLTIQLMGKNWLGRERMRDVHLERYFITRLTRTTDREAIILSKKSKDPSPGLRISLREGENRQITVMRIDANETPVSEPTRLEGIDAAMVKRLWSRIDETTSDLVRYRSQLLAASLYGKPVTELDTPATIAIAFIQAVAPLTRDMLRHSRTPGELQLKRDLGDGRREELFISHQEVTGKYAKLPSRNRKLFNDLGLHKLKRSSASDRPSSPQQSRRRSSRPGPSQPASQPPASQPPASQPPASQPRPSQPSPSQPASQPPASRPRPSRPRPSQPASRPAASRPSPSQPSPSRPSPSQPRPQSQPRAVPGAAHRIPAPKVPLQRRSSSFPPPAPNPASEPPPASDRQPRFDIPPPSIPPRGRPNLRVVNG